MSTQESSELVDAYAEHHDTQVDRAAVGAVEGLEPAKVDGGVLLDSFDPEARPAELGEVKARALVPKVSSPELASLAAKYVNLDADDLIRAVDAHREGHDDLLNGIADLRRLAASVLSQA